MRELSKQEIIPQSSHNSPGVFAHKMNITKIPSGNNFRGGYRDELEPVKFENTTRT